MCAAVLLSRATPPLSAVVHLAFYSSEGTLGVDKLKPQALVTMVEQHRVTDDRGTRFEWIEAGDSVAVQYSY